MRYLILFSFLFSLCFLSLVPYSWSNHKVGEPKLEELPIWSRCCEDRDCVPQRVKINGKEGNTKISVEIEGVQVSVFKEKFHPVPTNSTWVCYLNREGGISNGNIRCILYPQQSGTTETPRKKNSPDES